MPRNVTDFTDRSGSTPAGTEYLHGHREGAGDSRSSKWTLSALRAWFIAGLETVSGSTSKASAAQAAAIAAAESDATTKANAAAASAASALSSHASDTSLHPSAASQAEAESGTESALRAFSPLRIAQAIAALVPANDGKSIRETIVAANSFSDGQHVYKNGATWALGRADSAATCQGLWYVENATPGSFDIVRGRVTVPSGLGLSPGSYYIDAATAGLFTATAPTNAAHFVVPCLVVEAGNVGTFWPPAFPSSNALLDLTADVSGVLPVANGGTGTATPGLVAGSNVTISGVWPNQTVAASGGGGGGVLSVLLAYGEVASNMAATTNFIGGSTGYRKGAQVDATNFTQARLLCTRDSSSAATGSRMALRYVAAGSNAYMTVGNYVAAGTTEIELNLETTSNTLATAWINLAAGAKGDRYFAPITYGGDGVADPSVGNVYVQFK